MDFPSLLLIFFYLCMKTRERLFGRPTILSSVESTYFSKWYHFSTSSIFLLTLQHQLKAPTGDTNSCSTIHRSLFQGKILVSEDSAKGSGPDRYLWQGRRQDILELEISTAALTNHVDIDPVTVFSSVRLPLHRLSYCHKAYWENRYFWWRICFFSGDIQQVMFLLLKLGQFVLRIRSTRGTPCTLCAPTPLQLSLPPRPPPTSTPPPPPSPSLHLKHCCMEQEPPSSCNGNKMK